MASPAATMGRKRAVLVGINYPGTKAELKGCLNDVARMRRCLIDRFGFDDADIRVLTDAGPSTTLPTGANIRLELERLVGTARPGDALFFHYSGHGLRLPSETGQDDDTGYYECIVPCDTNLIEDQDFTELVQKVPDGCLFTMVSDSCNSGGLIDKIKEQIGNSTKQSKARPRPAGACLCVSLVDTIRRALKYIGIRLPRRAQKTKPLAAHAATVASRSLPLSTYIRMLKEQTGKDDVGLGSIRTSLFHHFGEDATPMIKKFVKAMAGGKLRHSPDQVVVPASATSTETELTPNAKPDGDEALGPAMEQEVHNVDEVYAGAGVMVAPPPPSRNGVLISGCQTNETSSEVITADGAYYGALSNAIHAVLEKKRGKVATNRELVLRARGLLSRHQHPGLYCSDEHADAAFICWFAEAASL